MKLKRFTSKMYLVTYEHGTGNYSKAYGIAGVHNKATDASIHMQKLVDAEDKLHGCSFVSARKKSYNIKVVDLSNQLATQLFEYNY
jgi:hypothetical protein